MPASKLSTSNIAEIVQLYTTPLSDGTWLGAKTIGKLFGVDAVTVRYRLRKQNVPIRSPREAAANGKRCRPYLYLRSDNPPLCICGCGELTSWNRATKQWANRLRNHAKASRPYYDKTWLHHAYTIELRSLTEIADACGVALTAVILRMKQFNIPIRSHSDSLILRGSCSKEKNPAWRGGIAKWSYSPNWKRIAYVIRKRDAYTCQLCSVVLPATSKDLHTHHIDSNRYNNRIDNLIALCRWCHPKGRKQEKLLAPSLHAKAIERNALFGLIEESSWRAKLRAVGIRA
jgi:hypothetical protein